MERSCHRGTKSRSERLFTRCWYHRRPPFGWFRYNRNLHQGLTLSAPDWTAGGASAVEWPVDKAGNGVGGKGNQGVSAAVINTPNSIGYVEISFAVANGLTFADLVNKAGNKVTANAESIASAMATFGPGAFDDKLTATIVDGDGAGDWPIVGYTYLILHTTSMTGLHQS